MRFIMTLKNDIQFQFTYGFYFLYAFFTTMYVLVLFITPQAYKSIIATIIILSDPALLGLFFIGGIWLLEKEEGLHSFWNITPLRPMEYILSKSISLAFISTLSAILIVGIGMGIRVNLPMIAFGVFLGSLIFNIIGLIIASYAHSVNHYILILLLPMTILTIPTLFTAFGWTHPIWTIFQGSALWDIVAYATGVEHSLHVISWVVLLVWFGLSLYIAQKRIPNAFQIAR